MNCPNKNTIEWKTLVDALGEIEAYKAYLAMGEELLPLSTIESFLSAIPKKEEINQESKDTKVKPLHELQGYESIQDKIDYLKEFEPDYNEQDIEGETIKHFCK